MSITLKVTALAKSNYWSLSNDFDKVNSIFVLKTNTAWHRLFIGDTSAGFCPLAERPELPDSSANAHRPTNPPKLSPPMGKSWIRLLLAASPPAHFHKTHASTSFERYLRPPLKILICSHFRVVRVARWTPTLSSSGPFPHSLVWGASSASRTPPPPPPATTSFLTSWSLFLRGCAPGELCLNKSCLRRLFCLLRWRQAAEALAWGCFSLFTWEQTEGALRCEGSLRCALSGWFDPSHDLKGTESFEVVNHRAIAFVACLNQHPSDFTSKLETFTDITGEMLWGKGGDFAEVLSLGLVAFYGVWIKFQIRLVNERVTWRDLQRFPTGPTFKLDWNDQSVVILAGNFASLDWQIN